jgi:hypothetical protein
VITLAFRPVNGESLILVRGIYFRICADGTLRGPDNAAMASYTAGRWQLGRRQHSMLECREPVYLRVTHANGQRDCIGPYEALRVTGGAIFWHDTYLGAHMRGDPYLPVADIWTEIALLSEI